MGGKREKTSCDVLLLFVNDNEQAAVFEAARKHNLHPSIKPSKILSYHDFGEINGLKVFGLQTKMGATGRGATGPSTSEAIKDVNPEYIIAVGIAFGVNEEKQQIGNILVSDKIFCYEPGKIEKDGTRTRRGDEVSVPDRLWGKFKTTSAYWKDAKIIFGPLLSGEKLLDHFDTREQLKNEYPEAIGGEMEAAGIYSASEMNKKDWIIVKAICDFAYHKEDVNKEQNQKTAAANAASFVFYCLTSGAFPAKKKTKNSKTESSGNNNTPANQLTTVLPCLSPDEIIGRHKDLEDLHHRLFNNKKVVLVNGLGGIGNRFNNLIVSSPPLKEKMDLSEEIRGYCEKAEALHDAIPLMGFKTKLRVPILIDEMYVNLRAIVDMRTTGHMRFYDSKDAHQQLKSSGQWKEISIVEAFNEIKPINRRGIVILGDPGSGKTTHLKRLLLWCLRGGLKKLGLPEDMIPVFLPLRELMDLSGGLDDFIQAQLNKRHLKTPEGFGQAMLKRGNLLFLFDGLDEVAEFDKRKSISRWIEEALILYPDCHFVVTCRFAGYSDKVQLNPYFLEMHIRPFDENEVRQFIHNWYTTVETDQLPDKEQAAIIAREQADNLIQHIESPEFRARRVYELTHNPLLLMNLCLVNRGRSGYLPRGRAELYEECMEVLLELWRDAIGYQRQIDTKSGRRVLQPAALWLHQKKDRTRATANELSPIIKPALLAVRWKHGTPRDFLNAIRNESGLLTGWDQENYGFIHLGFQEYLAAREIRIRAFKDPSILKELAAHFDESWWQEVILLLLAFEKPSHFEKFMAEVVSLPLFTDNLALVDLCLDDAKEKSAQPFIDLIMQKPGIDSNLHVRQLEALKLLKRFDPAKIEPLVSTLKKHPYEPIRKWLKNQSDIDHQDVIYSKQGSYELVRIPAGSFKIGSNECYDEKPIHEVHLSEFYMGRYPVTNEEYERFLKTNPGTPEPKYWGERKYNQSKQPVVGVSWHDAENYATWSGLQLPTEAQWEYACRADTTTRFNIGDKAKEVDKAGWYEGNSNKMLHPVGLKEPNKWGLYDMHGNIFEWCFDSYCIDYYAKSPSEDPKGPNFGDFRVVRGGSWNYNSDFGRSTYRHLRHHEDRFFNQGFRLVFLPDK